MTINRLSKCKTLDDFNRFVGHLEVSQKNARTFVLLNSKGKEKRSYTMNQIVHRLEACVKKADAAAPETGDKIRIALKVIDARDEEASSAPPSTCCLSMRKTMGNAWFSFKHLGFNKKKVLNAIRPLATPSARAQVALPLNTVAHSKFAETIREVPAFKFYQVPVPESDVTGQPTTEWNPGNYTAVLTGIKRRPANLFFDKLFEGSEVQVVQPNSGGKLFAFNDYDKAREHVYAKARDEEIAFSAAGQTALMAVQGIDASKKRVVLKSPNEYRLEEIFGDATYRISVGELQDTLESQQIYVSPLFPKAFYLKLKDAMREDNIVCLPGHDQTPVYLETLKTSPNYPALKQAVLNAEQDPQAYGFENKEAFDDFCKFSLYEIGAMVVKTEDFRIFTDANGKIKERQVGTQDDVCLINLCGIRGLHWTRTEPAKLQMIMTHTFDIPFLHKKNEKPLDIVVFPAVGMGVWGGDPQMYWPAFLDAVVRSANDVQEIWVNPNHQPTRDGNYKGAYGQELRTFIHQARLTYADNPKALANLDKIILLDKEKTDLVLLVDHIKKERPELSVGIVNASDPDVTGANHVGEYTNHWPHGASTTEENYTALGTNGLCFEQMTQVLEDGSRLFQVVEYPDSPGTFVARTGITSLD